MNLSSILIFCWILFTKTSVFGQIETLSKHQFSFYINDKKKSTSNAEILVVVSGDTIKGKYDQGFYYFPSIDSSAKFDIIVKVKDIIFLGKGYPSWMLNKGSTITFGKLTKLKSLKSVAEDNDITEKDENWEVYSKRFFVINRTYTLDIDNKNRIKELQFLIINPYNSGKLVTMQNIVR